MNISGLERHLVVVVSMRFQMMQYESCGILDFCFSIKLFHVTKHKFHVLQMMFIRYFSLKLSHTNLLPPANEIAGRSGADPGFGRGGGSF